MLQPSSPFGSAELPGLSFATAVSLETLPTAPRSSGRHRKWRPSATWAAGGGGGGKCPVALPILLRPTQIHPLLCRRRSSYQLFGRLLLGFSKQPHGLLNSSYPFRLPVPCAQAGHGLPPGRGRWGKSTDAPRRERSHLRWYACADLGWAEFSQRLRNCGYSGRELLDGGSL